MRDFKGLNPFRAGRCLSTESAIQGLVSLGRSQSLSSRAMSFDHLKTDKFKPLGMSQSLSSRAMSFDQQASTMDRKKRTVSIPFEQGDVFRQHTKATFVAW